MTKLTICIVISAMALLVTNSTRAAEVYSENFTSNPGFVLDYTPVKGEEFTWNSPEGFYKIVVKDEHDVYKYALTPEFMRVEDMSFMVQVDIKPVFVSFGQGMRIIFYDSDSGYTETSLYIQQGGSSNPTLRIGGSGMEKQQTPDTTMGVWYRVRLTYDYTSKSLNSA